MLAAVRSGEKERFAEEWALAKQTFDMKGGFSYRYSPKQQKLYPVNAAVDDLRIIRALYEAGDTFRDKHYTEEADKYGERFYNYNVKMDICMTSMMKITKNQHIRYFMLY